MIVYYCLKCLLSIARFNLTMSFTGRLPMRAESTDMIFTVADKIRLLVCSIDTGKAREQLRFSNHIVCTWSVPPYVTNIGSRL